MRKNDLMSAILFAVEKGGFGWKMTWSMLGMMSLSVL